MFSPTTFIDVTDPAVKQRMFLKRDTTLKYFNYWEKTTFPLNPADVCTILPPHNNDNILLKIISKLQQSSCPYGPLKIFFL